MIGASQEDLDDLGPVMGKEELYMPEQIEPSNYYRENIFSLEDFFLFKAVLFTYSGAPIKATEFYEKSQKTK